MIEKNNLNNEIVALKKEVKELNERNTRQYNSYKERIRDMSHNALENSYMQDSQQKRIEEL